MYPPVAFDNTGTRNGQLPSGQAPNGVAAGLPAHHMPTGHGPTGTTTLGPHVPGPDTSGRTAPPQEQPVNPVGSLSLFQRQVPEFGAAEQPLKEILMENQRGSWLSRFLFPEEYLAVAQEKAPSDAPGARLQTRHSVYHTETRSPARPRAPAAPMYKGDPLPNIPDCRCSVLLFINFLTLFCLLLTCPCHSTFTLYFLFHYLCL